MAVRGAVQSVAEDKITSNDKIDYFTSTVYYYKPPIYKLQYFLLAEGVGRGAATAARRRARCLGQIMEGKQADLPLLVELIQAN